MPDDFAITPAALKRLDRNSVIAMAARRKWIDQANDDYRRGKQLLPGGDWDILMWRSGRGFGKSLAIHQAAWWEAYENPGIIVHALHATKDDLTTVTFEGPVGFCALIPPELLYGGSLDKAYSRGSHRLHFANGSVIIGFSTREEGKKLRGPQCHFLCGDELAVWDQPKGNLEEAFNNAMFGVRLPYPNGKKARAVLATTPRPIPFLKRLEKRKGVAVIEGSSYENLRNLAPTMRSQLLSLEGTLLGKQEIEGKYIDEEASLSIFHKNWFRLWPAGRRLPDFSFVLEVYDTASYGDEGFDAERMVRDPTASVIFGVFNVASIFTESERKAMKIRFKNGIIMCDCWEQMYEFPDLLDVARKQHRTKWGYPGKRSDIVLIEEKSSGIALRQTMAKWGIPCWPFNPGSMSKTQRAHAVSPFVKQGMVFLPESSRPDRKGQVRDWIEPFLEQVCAYAGPGSTEHDDFVDCITSSLLYLRPAGSRSPWPGH